MSILSPGHCETCKWWGAERAHSDDHPYGTCRVLPPVRGEAKALPYHDPDRPSAAGPIVRMGDWPWTAFDDWCGQYWAKPPAPTSDEISAPGGSKNEARRWERHMTKWQSIDTAPKDGTPVLVTCDYMSHRQFSVAWNEGNGWNGGASAIPNLYWTAWMPLPPAPTSDEISAPGGSKNEAR